jgi:hypothetical protein
MSKTTWGFLLVGLCSLIQVTSVYAFNPDRDSSLIGCWKLDEAAGTTALDSSDHGNNGTVLGNPTWVAGKFKGALNFDGAGDYVDCGNAPIFTFQDAITVSAWVNIRAVSAAWQAIVAKGENAWRLSCNNTSQTFHFGITYYTNANYSANGAVSVGLNEWHHLTGTFDGKDIKLYVDGVLDTTTTGASPMGTSTTHLFIGENPESSGRYWNGLIDDVRIYRKALLPTDIATIMSGLWAPVADNPTPANKATDVPREVILGWKAGPLAGAHNVYFGSSFDDVNTATTGSALLVSAGQDANTYDPAGRLDFGTTYYWRVDEVNASADHAVFQGEVWQFTTEPFAYAVQNVTATASSQQNANAGPQNTVNGSGLTGDGHDMNAKNMWLSGTVSPAWIKYDLGGLYKLHEMWVWNHNTAFESILGFGIKNATVEYSTDGSAWTKLGDFEFNQAPGEDGYVANTTVSFGGATAKFVRITSNGTWGGKSSGDGLSEVRFFNIPVLAREPQPATNSTNVNPTTLVLGWRPGREAASHSVYVGADANALTLIGTATTTSFTPANLSLSTKYYWRVDEVNAAETPATWTGDAWNFTTSDYLVVDDMESYNDVDPTRVFDVWVDGYGTTSNGSVVGYSTAASGTFNETTIIHGGTQSMPFAYGTDGIATSEATRTFDATQDWTAAGIKTLVLFFHGDAANTTGQLYVKINSTKVNYGGNVAGLAAGLWKQWNVDLASASGANLKAVKSLTIGISSGKGILYFDDLRLYKAAPDVVVPVNPGTTGLVSLFDMESGKTADSVSGITGTLTSITFANSMTGLGQTAVFNGTTGYVDLGADYWTKVVSKLSSCTLAMWVNYTGTGSAWQRIIDLGCGTNVNTFLTTGANTLGMARFVVKTDVPNAASTATGYSEATVSAAKSLTVGWHHIAGVVDATGGTPVMYLYVDGAVAGGPSAGRLPKDMTVQTGTAWQMWLGRSQYTADPYFNGSLDDLRVYNRALSAGEVGYLAGDR